ncbi:MAG: RHS repeat-associated core domain-containing protein [Chloroflexi bacterium]|nr:RHS repeat-associated core domain-containing protein [Chloroflexota bacterium]
MAVPGNTLGIDPDGAYSKDPVNLATGVFTARADDLAMPGRVLPLAFSRWYNSSDTTPGPLGPAWTHSYNSQVTDSGSSVEIRGGTGRRDVFTRSPDGTYAPPIGVFDTLVKNADSSFTLILRDQVRYEFSTTGSLTRIHEPAGNQITFGYVSGNLSTITDTSGRQTALTYDTASRLIQIQDLLARRVSYAYDAQGRLSTVTDRIGNQAGQDPLQHRWTYAYDGGTQRITTITDPDGRVIVTNTYDGQGRVTQQRDGLSALTQIAYAGSQTTVTDPRGHQTVYAFDSRMRILGQTDTVGSNTYALSYTYDAAGHRTSVTDRNGQRTDLTYDVRGNVLTKTDPQLDAQTPRFVTEFQYDARNNLIEALDARGFRTTMTYDATTDLLMRVDRQIDATTWAVTRYEYGDAADPGLPTRIISPRGNMGSQPDPAYSTTMSYDSAGNLIGRTDADGVTTTFVYDAVGRLTSLVDPAGNAPGGIPTEHTWTVSYDANDRELGRTDPLGHTIGYAYDRTGDRTSVTDRNGNVTSYTFDEDRRIATVAQRPDPTGQPTLVYTTSVTRDGNGNATRITQANGAITDYSYDAVDRLVAVTTHPTAQTNLVTSYILDGNGQPLSRTTGDGVTVSYAYDALTRLRSVSGPSLSITYSYDQVGHRTQMVDATGTTTYAYDGLGRVTQTAAPNGILTYGYDLDGNRTRLGYPGGDDVDYFFTPAGRLTHVTDWAGRLTSYTYASSGAVEYLDYANGMSATYAYDRAQRLTRLTNTVGSTIISDHVYTLDPEGDRTALDEFVQGITLPPAWTSSVRVNDDTGGAVQESPALALGPDDSAYLAWRDLRSGNGDVYFSSRAGGTETWSPNVKVSSDSGTRNQGPPSIAIDGSSKVYAVWQDERDNAVGATDSVLASQPSTTLPCCGSYYEFLGMTAPSVPDGWNLEEGDGLYVPPGVYSFDFQIDVFYDYGRIYGTTPEAEDFYVTGTIDSLSGAPTFSWLWDNYGRWRWTGTFTISADEGEGYFRLYIEQQDPGDSVDGWRASAQMTVSRISDPNIYFAKRDPATGTWSANIRVNDDTTSGFVQREPRISVRSDGGATAVWVDGRSTERNIYAAQLMPGANAWGTNRRVSDETASWKVAPDVAFAPDGTAYAVWMDTRNGVWYDLYFSSLAVGAPNWSANTKINDIGGSAYSPRITVDGSGNVMVAWFENNSYPKRIRVRRLAAGSSTWTAASTSITDAASRPCAYEMGLATRSDGLSQAAWPDCRESGMWWARSIYGSTYDPITGTWLPSSRLSEGLPAGAFWRSAPAVAFGGSEIGAAWRDDGAGNPDVRSSHRSAAPQGVDHFAYSFDGLTRLTAVSGPLPETFTLDAATNIATRTGPTATYSYDTANRMTGDGSRTYTWNAADRLVQRGADTFSYDALARLTSSTVSGSTRTFSYDGDGLLTSATQGATAAYLWDSTSTPAVLLKAGTDRIVWGLGPLYGVRGDGTTYTFARDALGSVRAEVNGAGTAQKTFLYSAFGEPQGAPAGSSPTLFGFVGELRDASGLIYLRARWYDPATGRFMSRDPVPGDATIPVSLNGYAYGYGDPTRFTDPSGRCGGPLLAVCIGAIVGGITGAAGAVAQGGSLEQVAAATAVGALGGAAVGYGATSVWAGALIGAGSDLVGQIITTRDFGRVNWGSVAGAAAGGALAAYGGRETLRVFVQADRVTREAAAALIGVGPSAGLPLVLGAIWDALRRDSGDRGFIVPRTGEGLDYAGAGK